jgi:thioredoxin 1
MEVTDANFDEIKARGVVLVEFWAEVCPLSRTQGRTVRRLAEAFIGQVKVGRAEVDDCPQLAVRLGVALLPTVIVYRNGQEIERLVDVQGESTLASALRRALQRG